MHACNLTFALNLPNLTENVIRARSLFLYSAIVLTRGQRESLRRNSCGGGQAFLGAVRVPSTYDSPNAKIPIRKQPLIEVLFANLKIPRAAAASLDPGEGKDLRNLLPAVEPV